MAFLQPAAALAAAPSFAFASPMLNGWSTSAAAGLAGASRGCAAATATGMLAAGLFSFGMSPVGPVIFAVAEGGAGAMMAAEGALLAGGAAIAIEADGAAGMSPVEATYPSEIPSLRVVASGQQAA